MTQDISTTTFAIDQFGRQYKRIITEKEEEYIVNTLVRAINIPFMSQKEEKIIFKHGIELIDKVLSEHLPKEWIDYLHNHHKGIEEAALRVLEARMIQIIEKIIIIPIVPEYIEALIISTILNVFINSLKKKSALKPRDY
jgi:hypothetical protein